MPRPSNASVAPSRTPVSIILWMNCFDWAVITGPINMASLVYLGSNGSAAINFFESSTNCAHTFSYISSPTATMADEAMQRWPAQP